MNSTLTIRTDKKIKQKASKILAERGLNLSIVLNMHLRRIVGEAENPFKTEDMTLEDFIAYKKAMEDFKSGHYITMEDYEIKRFSKI